MTRTHRHPAVWGLLAAVLLALGSVGPARADSPDDVARAQEHVDKGDRHFDNREFDQAIAEYTAALVLHSHPDLVWNIARAHEESGRPAEAIALLQRYVGMARNSSDRAAALDRIARLEAQVGQSAAALVRGHLVVRTQEGAWVTVGGARVGQGPEASIAVKPGRYRVHVEAEGFAPAEQVVKVTSGGDTVVALPLAALVVPAAPAEVAAPQAPADALRSLEGSYVFSLRPGRSKHDLQGAHLTLDAAGNGTLDNPRRRPLETWRRSHCGGATELSWTARYTATLGGRLKLSGGRIDECSCSAFCPGADDLELSVEPLADFMGWISADLLIVRPSDLDRAQPVPAAPLSLAGRWRVDQWDVHPEARELELSGEGVGTLTVERTGEVLSWQRRRCGGASTWRQAVVYAASSKREGERLRFHFDAPEEIACSCSDACTRPGPLRELSVEELGVDGYLAAPTGARLHRLP